MFPTLAEMYKIFFDENACIEYLFENKILDQISTCSVCHSIVKRDGVFFKCRDNKVCRKKVSIFHNSFFSGSRLKCNQVMLLLYLYHTKTPNSAIKAMTGHSDHTVVDYRHYYMQLLASDLKDEDAIIGGPDVIVEIDECKLGKRKYNRGHRVEGVWILVGVEKTEERKIFIETIPDRTRETLHEVISRHVLPGSIIHTDFWKSYLGVEDLGMRHGRVNHSQNFRDPITGINTNTVEGNNNGIKLTIAPRNRNIHFVDEYLSVYIWMRRHGSSLWGDFIEALRSTAYIE
jgi:hypothetical protein